MIDTDALRGVIAERGLSQRAVAKQLGMTDKTFYIKMSKRCFKSNEMEKMVRILKLSDPAAIFFAKNVTQ